MAIQSAVACSEAKKRWWSVGVVAADGVRPGLVLSSSLVMEDGFLFAVDKNFDFYAGQM